MSTLKTRWLLMKKQWISLLFWLLLPLCMTWAIITTTSSFQDDSKIPVGVVQEDHSPLSQKLINRLSQSSLLHIYELDFTEALRALKRHELDSVFMIHDGYEQNILQNNREQLITGYKSNLSFAYTPVKEIIVAHVQKDTMRMKAATYIHLLEQKIYNEKITNTQTVFEQIDEREMSEHLLSSSLSFSNDSNDTKKEQTNAILYPPNIWAIASLLATFFIFDFVLKERKAFVHLRLHFMRDSWKMYLTKHFLLLTVFLFLCDLITFTILSLILKSDYYLWSKEFLIILLSYRLTINFIAFLFAQYYKSFVTYYIVAIIFTLFMMITSSAILPIDSLFNQVPLLQYIHPIQPFIYNSYLNGSLLIMSSLFIIWLVKKENNNA